MESRAEVQQRTIARAREFADRRGHRGGGYALEDYTKALSELSPEDREVERGFSPVGEDGNQTAAASRHFAERVRHFTTQGHNHARSVELAKGEEGPGLRARRAGFPVPSADALPPHQREQIAHFALMTGQRPGEVAVTSYAAGGGPRSTSEVEKLATARDTLVRQVAASCLQRGISQPDGHERDWVDSWYGVNLPPPPPTAGTTNQAALDRYNKGRQTFIELIFGEARAVLRDPAERATLTPTRLGG